MPTLRDFVVVAALAVSTTAFAAPSHLTDMQYIEAARCQALIASPSLGKGDTSSIDALLKSEGRSRIDYVSTKADETRRETARLASQASPERRATLMAERDGPCTTFSGEHPTTVTTASGATSSN